MALAFVEPGVAPAFAAPAPARFVVTHDATGYRVDAVVDLDASVDVVWQTLTDYERLPRYMPGIEYVRVVSSVDDGSRQLLRVEQAGEAQFLFYRRRVGVMLDIVHEPRKRITTVAVPRPGDAKDAGVKVFQGSYTLQPREGGSGAHLVYEAHIVPDFRLPPLIDVWLVRHSLQTQFDSLLAEIERRRLAAIGAAR